MKKITFFIGFLCIVGNLSASLVKVEFEGVIDSVGSSSDLLPSYLTVGATYTGYYVYDNDINPDNIVTYSNGITYNYNYEPSAIYVEIINPNNSNDYLSFQSTTADEGYSITISNVDGGQYVIRSNNIASNNDLLSPVVVFDLSFYNSDNSSFGLRPALLDEYEMGYIFIDAKDYNNELVDFNFGGVVTKTTVVPEPSIISMVVIGTIGIIKSRKR